MSKPWKSFIHPFERRRTRKRQMKSPYSYKPLTTAASYRAMRLEPGNFQDDIWFSLAEYVEGDSYHAISYAWESTELTHIIYSVDGFLRVTKNLLSALRQYRLPDRPISVWADAVCISQANMDERARQVQLMATIFSKSDRVFVWLGEELETDRITFDYITKTVHAFEALPNTVMDDARLMSDFVSRLVDEAEDRGYAQGVTTLLEKSWFSRAWTYQEIICAQNATVSCGSLRIDWNYISNFAMSFWDLNITGTLLSVLSISVLIQVAHYHGQRKHYRDNSAGYSLVHAVASGRMRKCTDPRDKIYSVLGIAPQSNTLPYPPNYTIGVNQVYEDFARHVICQAQDLDIIKHCVFKEADTSQAASWAPNWMTESAPLAVEPSPGGTLFRACKSRQPQIFPSARTNELIVEGMLLDGITRLSEVPFMNDLTPGNISDHVKQKERLIYHEAFLQETFAIASSSARYMDESECHEAWWRTLLSDKENDLRRATPDLEEHFKAYERVVITLSADMDDSYVLASEMHKFLEVARLIVESGLQRRFCLSEDGRLGWVPEAAREGDLVSILFGSSTPVLLRPKGDSFLVLGQCYIHGIMDGEAMTEENLSRARPICLI